jgi:hypothetical protein
MTPTFRFRMTELPYSQRIRKRVFIAACDAVWVDIQHMRSQTDPDE